MFFSEKGNWKAGHFISMRIHTRSPGVQMHAIVYDVAICFNLQIAMILLPK